MSLKPGVIDANVLIYSMASEAPQHSTSRAFLDAVRDDPEVTFYVTSQILCEFYAVVTNPRRMTSSRSSAEALTAISGFLTFLEVLPISMRAVEGRMDLLRRRPVTGANIFDLQLAATMLANGVNCIYTFNASDFQPFRELSVNEP
jgi:predicted nucleic acid-binding protein